MNNADMSSIPVMDEIDYGQHYGLTKREHFAGLALQGLLSGGYCINDPCNRLSDVPSEAVALADALLAELEK